jgi:hypothetical protein
VLMADFSGRSAGGDQADLQSAGRGAEADEHRSGIISIARRIQTNACHYSVASWHNCVSRGRWQPAKALPARLLNGLLTAARP